MSTPKSPRYWVTLIYKLFLTYDEVTSEHESTYRTSGVRFNVPDAALDESESTGETIKRRVPRSRSGVSKRILKK